LKSAAWLASNAFLVSANGFAQQRRFAGEQSYFPRHLGATFHVRENEPEMPRIGRGAYLGMSFAN
jgi:hypothetical protein